MHCHAQQRVCVCVCVHVCRSTQANATAATVGCLVFLIYGLQKDVYVLWRNLILKGNSVSVTHQANIHKTCYTMCVCVCVCVCVCEYLFFINIFYF